MKERLAVVGKRDVVQGKEGIKTESTDSKEKGAVNGELHVR
jgi:hypothetical protein